MGEDLRYLEVTVIIVAGGSGSRMGGPTPKQFMTLCGAPILSHTIDRFAKYLPGSTIVVVLPKDEHTRWEQLCVENNFTTPHILCEGGATRFDSVKRGLESVPTSSKKLLIHDGVRPIVSEDLVKRVVDALDKRVAVIPTMECIESLREVDSQGSHIVDRKLFFTVQTPQGFETELIKQCYRVNFDPIFTDDASVVESQGVEIECVTGDRSNIKITTPEDMVIAAALLNCCNPIK